MFVALTVKSGLNLLTGYPRLTAALVIDTILTVVLFQGVPVGPLIGAGVACTVRRIAGFVVSQ